MKRQTFKFKPFSRKQRMTLNWWTEASPVKNYSGIIADGAIRSGKTISMSLSFVIWAMSTFSGQNFAMCGKTIGSFRRNVLFWLKLMLQSRGYSITDHRADNLVVVRKDGKENYFYIFGGKDERSQDLIQGITLAGVFFDEVALMPESFVNQATGRCSVEGSKFWFNCNPDGPYHWFKINWIDKSVGYLGKERTEEIRKKAAKEGKDPGLKEIVYLHFTMDDNLCNIMNLVDDMPALSTMLTIIQAAMLEWEHGIKYERIKQLYDQYTDEGGNQMSLYRDIVLPTLAVSGFFTEDATAQILEAAEI